MQINFKYISTRTGKSLILNIENKRYVFNLFEGFQRYAIGQNLSLKGINTVFLPDISGIPAFLGFYLTIRDMEKKLLNVVCSEDVSQIIESAEIICPKKELKFNFIQNYKDEFIKVKTINKKGVQNYTIDFVDIPGKLLIDKIPKALPKKFYSDLKNGKNVEFNDEIYKGSDFIEKPVKIGKVLLIFKDCKNFESFDKNEFKLIFCFDPLVYRNVQKRFNNVYFMNINEEIEFVSQYNIQKKLNELDPNFLLPSPINKNLTYGHIAAMKTSSKIKESDCGKEKRKKKENACVKNILINHKNEIIKKLQGFCINSGDEIFFKQGFKVQRVKSKKYVQVKNELINNSLTFLGTGCALPSKYRNVSSVLYCIDDNLILFDVGEDTLSQLNRIYGHLDIIKKIKFIFISHSHADHCLGIINLLKVIKHDVVVIAPNALIDFLLIYNFKNVEFYDTTPTKEVEPEFNEFFNTPQKSFRSNFKNIVKKLGGLEKVYESVMRDYVFKIEIGDFTFNVCGVEHNSDSCSVSLVYKNKIKISYSGDTRPSLIFAIMSKDSDAFIHESTFNGNNLDKAIKTKHSTVQEANDVYEFSKSKTLFLTHFSQRYPKGFITIYKGIPCMDFYRYVLNESTFNKNKVNNFLKTLEF